MSARTPSPSARVLAAGDRCLIPVPWSRADRVHYQLRQRGFPATLCIDPEARVARLEFWPGVDREAALAALGGLIGRA